MKTRLKKSYSRRRTGVDGRARGVERGTPIFHTVPLSEQGADEPTPERKTHHLCMFCKLKGTKAN